MRLHQLVVPSIALALLAGCTDDPPATPVAGASAPGIAPSEVVVAPDVSLDVPAGDPASLPPRPEPGDEGGRNQPSATGLGPYQIGESQAEMVADEIVTGTVAANGCIAGSVFYGSPKIRFVGGTLAEVRTTSVNASTAAGVTIGADQAKVQAAYPSGKAVTGAAGVTGWEIVDGTNALLVEITAGKVTAITGGVATTVEQNFTSGQAC
ncbi:hypothetical protein [Actinoplanes derwentensis]|uniref:Uncharacterized protein n=1 Tax=Actinoplanes derwentensis TaxID=113562 RepID=A0A1H2CZH6_9ACTN|nr:hypothetical protein [Actinoplanes derwentensis]GID82975.1 hypothetical protein Ade03nite_18990 [Actinoplanes derwentensis]SDT75622.1 hypothetical protein SAMN04489716_7360 [Actinoplanes derwentensis]